MAARFIDKLRRAGLRITSQRIAVCECLASAKGHPTPLQIYEAVHRKHPDINPTTVYNTLNTLRDLGAIVEVSADAEHTRYEMDTSPHVELICLQCHLVSDLRNSLASDMLMETVFQNTGFRATTLQVQVTGYCPACQETNARR